MARSKYIYCVLHPAPANMDDHLVAAFTVKHELAAWWRYCKDQYKDEYEIWRIRDGRNNDMVQMCPEELSGRCSSIGRAADL